MSNTKLHPYVRLHSNVKRPHAAATQPWQVPDLCKAYNWPTGLTGGGVIGIVELGGGWSLPDMEAYFKSINQPVPIIVDVSVDGTQNKPGSDPQGADAEVALDIQISAAAYYCATGKPATVRVYWASDIAPAVRKAIDGGCDVFSISWGADESDWGVSAAQEMEAAARAATAAGMIVFAASGDNDSSDGGSTPANVDLPSSAPHVIGCGGTSKTSSSETVWNNNPGQATGEGTGGGYSTIFPAESWQLNVPAGNGRMVPDVAADADPNTGYMIMSDGQTIQVGGTSCAAPLYAGLFAALGTKLGFVTPQLYQNPTDFTDITSGDNGQYHAGTGPDPCTGLGAPIGSKIAASLIAAPTPQPQPPPPPNPSPTPPPSPAPPPVRTSKKELAYLIEQSIKHALHHHNVTEAEMKADIQSILDAN